MSVRRTPRTAVAAIAAAAVLTLVGCTAAPGGAPTTPPPAAAAHFVCPSTAQVARLTATSYSLSDRDDAGCTYVGDTGDAGRSVVVRHPASATAPRRATLSAVRDEVELDSGVTVSDLRAPSLPGFTSRSSNGTCTTWVYAVDGVVTSVGSRGRDGRTSACTAAGAIAALVAAAPSEATGSAVVDVVAPQALLGSSAGGASWSEQVATTTRAHVRRVTEAGLGARSTGAVDPDAAAVVFVSGTENATAPPLQVIRAATKEYSSALRRARRARLVVVGPVGAGAAPSDADLALRDELHTAARIAGATWIDPIAEGWDRTAANGRVPSTTFDALAKHVTDALRTDVLCSGSASSCSAR